jgi:CRP/FNR family transcriptional regulator, cyclic AMP receptor protein
VVRAMQLADLVAKRDDAADDPKLWTNVLADVPLFASLNERHRRKVAGCASIRRFHEGAALMKEGQPGEALYVILDGEVSIRPPGRKALVRGVGSFVGELALLDGGPRTATVVARGDVLTLAIGRARFHKLLVSEPRIAVAIAEELAKRLRAQEV